MSVPEGAGGRRPGATVITLTSDFGAGSPYVAAMKARLLEGCPGAVLVDVSHTVPPFDVISGAFVLWAGTRHFAPGAVHLVVVDPGVGSARRAVAFELGGSWYVGPDNGVFGLLLAEAATASPPARPGTQIQLTRPSWASPTFEGRDVFAPAAAALAAGRSPSTLGRPLEGGLQVLPLTGPAVLWVDDFGNLVTSLKPPVRGLRIADTEIRATARTFSEAPWGELFVYEGSMGFLEVAIREGRAADRVRARAGTPVQPL
ncbi:MAG TPA: SAM-dependent chlorinase/fluorinase [Candidatus Dormibacteraeota bacterium]|jgi:S-adenosylmethionine hydrolase|nr:SAM-dependent chlorinase/fluorinase [Candidatus Dormibacteraeota bacterium]